VNPTLTIIANAMRVAERIAQHLGVSTLAEPAVRPRMPAQALPVVDVGTSARTGVTR
jgi:hypothetical protein